MSVTSWGIVTTDVIGWEIDKEWIKWEGPTTATCAIAHVELYIAQDERKSIVHLHRYVHRALSHVHRVGLFLNHCPSTLACLLNSIFDTILDTYNKSLHDLIIADIFNVLWVGWKCRNNVELSDIFPNFARF